MGNGSSKYFKSTTKTKTKHINKNGGRAGGGGVGSAAAKVAARQAKNRAAIAAATKRSSKKDKAAKATAGSVHERNSGTGVVSRPATVTKSTATTTANTDNKITKSALPTSVTPGAVNGGRAGSGGVGSAAVGLSAWAINANKVWNDSIAKVNASKGSVSSGVDASLLSGLSATSNKATTVNAVKTDNSNRSILFDPTSRDKFLNGGAAKTAVDSKFSISTSTDKNDGTNLSFNNDTVAEKDKYNQAYWAKQVASGKSQADIKKEMDAVGSKAYSGAAVISEGNKKTALDTLKRVTGSDAVVGDGVTREWTQSGLLGEKVKGDFTWKDGTKVTTMADNPVVGGTFNKVTGRIDGGTRLGDYNSTTFVGTGNYTGKTAGTNEVGGTSKTGDQVAVASVKGGNDGLGGDAETVLLDAEDSVTLDDIITKKVDITTLSVDALTTVIGDINTVTDIDKIIETTTDAETLKSLYKRRLKLMRLGRTRTRHAGLLDDADTKKSQMSIV